MKLKLDDQGHVVVQDGKPVYVKEDGSEVAFDVAGTVATIARLNSEAKGHREAKETAEAALKAFEGITDPAAAKKALETIANLDSKKLIDAGEVEKVKQAAIAAVEEQYKPHVERAAKLEAELRAERIGGSFARSKFVADKLAIPVDMVEARFGTAFKMEDGKVRAYDGSGNLIYSKSNPGEPASFDEALEFLVNAYPQRDAILKGNPNGGSGARNGTGSTGGKTMTRTQFEALDAKAKSEAMGSGVTLTD